MIELLCTDYNKKATSIHYYFGNAVLVKIDCNKIIKNKEIILVIKQSLNFPEFCGNNWNAINDLICDVILPEKVVFTGWKSFEQHFPEDADFIKKIFNKVDVENCSVSYE